MMERSGGYRGRGGGGRGRSGGGEAGHGGGRGGGGRGWRGRGRGAGQQQQPSPPTQERTWRQVAESREMQPPARDIGSWQGVRSVPISSAEGPSGVGRVDAPGEVRGGNGGEREAWNSRQGNPAVASVDSSDIDVPEMQSLQISQQSSRSFPLENSKRLLPMKRPDQGGTLAIRTCRLDVNHFPVRFNPDSVVMHYDVDIKPESLKNGRPVKMAKSDLRTIKNKLFSDYPREFPLQMTAYDGEKNIFSQVKLPAGTYKVTVNGGEGAMDRTYMVSIKLVNELKLSKLRDYLTGELFSVPRDILQGLDLVFKENPTEKMICVGRNFFPTQTGDDIRIKGGVIASWGSQHGLKTTSQGLALCLDYSVLSFYKRMMVIDFLNDHISRFDLRNFRSFKREVENLLKGLKVTVTHRRTKQKFTVAGLTASNTRDLTFPVADPEDQGRQRQMRVVDHFREKYGKTIVYQDIPCLDLGNSNKLHYVPMEFCLIAEGQRYPKECLDRDATILLKNLSLASPTDRKDTICNMIRSEDGPCGGGIVRNFGMEVNMNMTTVVGRVIGPPELKVGAPNGRLARVTVDREKCHWNLVQRLVLEGKVMDRWGVIDFTYGDRYGLRANEFIPNLIRRCRSLGIYAEEPLIYRHTSMNKFSNVNVLRELLESADEEARGYNRGHLQILLCVMTERHPGYELLKWISETKMGILTQCCLSSNANDSRRRDQFLANLALKINAKLGGSNVELNGQLPHFSGEGGVMLVGADVNHPGARNTTSPSIAAVVATMNWPAANRYAARVRPQDSRKEKILHFGEMCLELVETYARLNKARPAKIIVFRDGVSEGQFDMVLNEELLDMKTAFLSIKYKPTITTIVAQKRHQTRLFPESPRDGRQTGNVSPGTVVDTRIVHHFEFDFYLCSHYGNLGTSKPTHYYVLRDEHHFTSDELQKLIYHICFTFARCTKPVSLVPPVYYADLVAYRGRLYYKAMAAALSPALAASSSLVASSSSSSSAVSFDERFFRLHADLENIMFFV